MAASISRAAAPPMACPVRHQTTCLTALALRLCQCFCRLAACGLT